MRTNGPTRGMTTISPPSSAEVDGAARLMEPESAAPSGKNPLAPSRRSSPVSTSLVIQLCLMLSVFCLSIFLYPGHLDSADAVQPELRHYVAKVASFLSSGEKPEIVILGSSLMLYPATLCDLQVEGKKPVDNNWYAAIFMPEYSRANYFEKLLDKQSHLNRHITNLAVASSLMSDHSLLLDSIIDAQKKPQLVICGIAPRDFIDNNQPDPDQTPVHKLVADLRPELVPTMAKPPVEGFFTDSLLRIKRAFTCLRLSANRIFCALVRRPENDYAAKMVPGVLNLPESKAKDLVLYDKVYNPVKLPRLTQQAKSLEHMLQVAQQNQIKVLLVNMPVTAENADLLPVSTLARYNRTVSDIAAKYQVTLLDLQRSPQFDAADFIDSCHLNARGGAKFYEQLAKTTAGLDNLNRPVQ
ncbi:MAG: hypothetical protein KGS72_14475 [Cyanobacteria bacterium REEB67]|nr:hypothetical protein [Cyanobacteria bacterium REEB67]